MAKPLRLKEASIRENIDSYNRRLIVSYSFIIILMIAFLCGVLYMNYKMDPEFYIRPTMFVGIILLPFIFFALVNIIKNKIYLNNFEESPVYKRIKKRYKLNNINDFEEFDRKVRSEISINILFENEKTLLMGTNSYIIKKGLPVNKEFDVYDASKLLLVIFNPLGISDLIIDSKFRKKGGHQIILYFEDEAVLILAPSKKKGEELSSKIASTYKVLKGNNSELAEFYNTDRANFIKTCREQAQKVYY